VLAYGANLLFAWTYNVGDVYIFFLPSHYVLALCAGAGLAALTGALSRVSNRTTAVAAGVSCLLYPAWRGYDTFPAVDRSWDHRAVRLLEDFTTPPTYGLPPRAEDQIIFGADTNWQAQNAIEYFMRRHKPALPWFVTEQLEWLMEGDPHTRWNTFVEANHEIGREVLMGPAGVERLRSLGYTGGFVGVDDHPPDAFSERLVGLRPGTPYALGVLLPDPEYPLDRSALAGAWSRLTAGSGGLPAFRTYTVVLGKVGEPPALVKSEDRPYRIGAAIGPFQFDVRMESWLPTDTIRRAGFGHVIVNRTHLLTLERGISFAAVVPGGTAVYASGLFAPIPRYALR
jgi:hypothetical protein